MAQLNKPASWQKQVNPNTKRMKSLMRDVRADVERRTRNSKDLDEWLENLSPYVANNCFNTGIHATDAMDIVNQIVGVVDQTSLPSGSNAEILKGTMAEACYTMVTNVGEVIRNELRQIAVNGYNDRLTPQELAREMGNKIDSLSKTRCQAIARTETCRAANIGNYLNAKESGAKSYKVICNKDCCEYCQDEYGSTGEGDGEVGDTVYSIDDIDNLPPLHPNCYSEDTQVFTNNGWKYFRDVTEEDKILSLNPETNETAFITPVNIIKTNNVHGKLYHIHNKWFDVCVTPDHDCFIHQRRDGGKRGKYFEPQFRKPSDLTSESRFVRCINTDRENPKTVNVNGLEFEPNDYAFFMAWYISEGSVLHNPITAKAKGYPIKITQEITENREIIKPVFQHIADYLGIKLYVGKSYFEFHSKELHDYLVKLGKSHEKYIPSELFTLNKECLNIFLEVYVLGDGHERTGSNELVVTSNERVVFTSSKQLKDDLSYLVLLCGYYPSISIQSTAGTVTTHDNGTYAQNHDVYCIRINKSQYTNYSSCTVDTLIHLGTVYCVELPYWHTLWVMRNGMTSWNGNCRCTPVWSMKEPNDDRLFE